MADTQPIIQQPVAGVMHENGNEWMVPNPEVQVPLGCPRGLEYLTALDQLIVKQRVELCEAMMGCEMNNKYDIFNSMGQQVYRIQEDTDCCVRQCCGPIRPVEFAVVDNLGAEVIHLSRPLNGQGCLCPCCLQTMTILSGSQILGHVEEQWSVWEKYLDIMDGERNVVLKIVGPCCPVSCGNDVVFKVLGLDGQTEVGCITKQWAGMVRELCTKADTFSVTFPIDLDVKLKAVMLGALFLIDFMFFENDGNNNGG